MGIKGNLKALLETERLFGTDFLPKGDKRASTEFDEFRKKVLSCTKCGLCNGRTQVVFGVGSVKAPLMFVGEAPGEDEDIQGEPFVGRAGKLLTKTLGEIGVKREQVYIANIVKCRPPQNRAPRLDEIAACMPYLIKQIEFIKPKFICALGNTSAHTLLGIETPMKDMRGKIFELLDKKVFPTYHPASILRNPNQTTIFQDDIKRVCQLAGLI